MYSYSSAHSAVDTHQIWNFSIAFGGDISLCVNFPWLSGS